MMNPAAAAAAAAAARHAAVFIYFYILSGNYHGQKLLNREVVVAQLAERSLTIPEDPGSIPVIGNFY